MRIEIISGSPRIGSVTRRVALHLKDVLSQELNSTVGFIDMQQNVLPPVQNVWRTADDAPVLLRDVARSVFDADGYIIVSPEYNGSYSPALKNFLDHFSKRERKVFGIVAASPGALGGVRAALQLQTMVDGLFGIGSPKMLIVPGVDTKFAENGTLLDQSFKPSVKTFVDDFLWLANAISSSVASRQARLVA